VIGAADAQIHVRRHMVEPFGPHHSLMRSGWVKHFHTSSRGASNMRVMTKSLLCAAGTVKTPG
jgi:hypothetical protein